MEFKTIYTFDLPHKAHTLKSKLEYEGITVYLKDELTVQSHNFLSQAVGGVKVQVRYDQVDEAIQVLKESGYKLNTENGNGEGVVGLLGQFRKNWKMLAVVLILFITAILIFITTQDF